MTYQLVQVGEGKSSTCHKTENLRKNLVVKRLARSAVLKLFTGMFVLVPASRCTFVHLYVRSEPYNL